MKLSEKIIISYIVLLSLIVVLVIINKTFSGYIKTDSEKQSRSEELLRKSASMQKAVVSMESEFRGYLLTGDSVKAASFFIAGAGFDELYGDGTNPLIKDSAQAALYSETGKMIKAWRDGMLIPLVLAQKDVLKNNIRPRVKTFDTLYSKVVSNAADTRVMKKIMDSFSRFDKNELDFLDSNKRALYLSLFRNDVTSLVMAIFILLAGTGITIFTTRNITRRMNTMIAQAEKISLGQFNKKIEDGGTDEMSRLADALNRMTASLNESFLKLEQTNFDLMSSNRDLEQFVFSASHDLKEPVRMVSIYTQKLADKYSGRISKAANEYIEFALEGARRILKLLDSLLAYLNISQSALNYEKVAVQGVIKNVLEKLHAKIQETQATVNFGLMPELECDLRQLELVFCHLIDNAINFRSAENPVIEIKVKWEDNCWVFSVSDNGIGIDPQYFEKVFVIFQRLNERDEMSGSGVGLTICKKIIEMHRGEIWIESEPGKGSTISFSLPGV